MTAKHPRSARPSPARPKHCTMSVCIPGAHSVAITGSFCNWSAEGRPMRPDGNGTWTATLELPGGRYEYRLLVDGQWQDDPGCPERVANGFGSENCVFHV